MARSRIGHLHTLTTHDVRRCILGYTLHASSIKGFARPVWIGPEDRGSRLTQNFDERHRGDRPVTLSVLSAADVGALVLTRYVTYHQIACKST